MIDADDSGQSDGTASLPGHAAPDDHGSTPGTIAAPTRPDRDVAWVYGRTDDGSGFHILRHRHDRLEMGELRTLRHAQPIHGEVVRLTALEGRNHLYDVEVVTSAPTPKLAHRPAQVASPRYRQNWESIFGTHPGGDDELPN